MSALMTALPIAAPATAQSFPAQSIPRGDAGTAADPLRLDRPPDRAVAHRLEIKPLGEVELDIAAGRVHIVGGEGSHLEVEGRIGDDLVGLWLSQEGRWTLLRAEPPAGVVDISQQPLDLEVELEIRLPAGSALKIRTVEATLELEAVRGRIEIETVTGRTRVEGQPRELRIEGIAGSVDLAVASPKVVARTISGPVVVRGSVTDLEAETVDAPLRVEATVGVEGFLRTVTGELVFAGELATTARLRTRASSGATRLELDPRQPADVHVETVSGTLDNALGPAFGPPTRGRYRLEMESDAPEAAKVELYSLTGPLVLVARGSDSSDGSESSPR